MEESTKKQGEEKKYVRPSWDEYFIEITEMVGRRGSCDRGRCGCVIVRNNRLIATGYAGSPIGLPHCDEIGHEMHTVIHDDGSQTQHCIRTAHAEQNAICEAARMGISLDGGTLYTKMLPCYTCAKMIINCGIKRVVCAREYHPGTKASQRTFDVFKEAGIEFISLNQKADY